MLPDSPPFPVTTQERKHLSNLQSLKVHSNWFKVEDTHLYQAWQRPWLGWDFEEGRLMPVRCNPVDPHYPSHHILCLFTGLWL